MNSRVVCLLVVFLCLFPLTTTAGNIDSPGTAPSAGSGLYTLDDLYNYLMSGAAATIPGTFQEPASGPASSSKTTKEILDGIKTDFVSCDATPDKVLDSVTFFSTDSANWGPREGTLSTQTLSAANDTVAAGYYAATTLGAVDGDLDAANIKTGINIFGVAGSAPVASGTAAAGDVLTGKTFSNNSGTGISGSMSDYSGAAAKTYTPGTADVTVDTGYHNGSKVSGDADLTAANIKSGTDIFGVTGTVVESTGDAAAGDVLTGKTFSKTGSAGLTGTMSDYSGAAAKTYTPGTADVTVDTGYHNGSKVSGDANLTATNIKTGINIFGVAGSAPVPSGTAATGDVLTGKTFSNNSGTGISGSMSDYSGAAAKTYTPGTADVTFDTGYHNGSKVSGDADLVTGNIKSGTTIFGVTGDPNVVDTSSGDAAEADIAIGKIAWVDGSEITGTGIIATYPAPVEKTGDSTDGDAGVAWPNPRFTAGGDLNGDGDCDDAVDGEVCDGTVTDNLTGLIWLKNANCFGPKNWATALTDCSGLANGSCGLSDSSVAGDWRLPNIKELQSLINYGQFSPALPPGHPFTGVQSNFYWSSSTNAVSTTFAWYVNLIIGNVNVGNKTNSYYVWPVRGGQ